MAEVPYQSLYRRYRPQTFGAILGQDHVVLALRNAVRDNKVAHAYLFSGPRGTGKTSAARILAKALNCEHLTDGEPDGTCESCLSIQNGTSFDVHELDAASNNGVEAMRELVSRAALGTPGRWKVYIVDEVHMLSTAASNALLKTLEEPPAHVVFVLATTDPQKVLPTIRSRTQHFEFRLLSTELLQQLVKTINDNAQLNVPLEALDLVVRRGKGSARDTLSVLDQVAAAGIVDDEHEVIDEIVESLCDRDTSRALVAVAEAMNQGRDAQRLAVDLLEYLRNGFLSLMSKNLVMLPDAAVAKVEGQARRLGAPALVGAMEALGTALLDMREAPEPRITLEVALVRLTKPELGIDPGALLQRIESLEKKLAGDVAPIPNQPTKPAPSVSSASAGTKSSQARPSLGAIRSQTSKPGSPSSSSSQTTSQQEISDSQPIAKVKSNTSGQMPTRDQLVEEWGDVILEKLPQRARSRYRMGRFIEVRGGKAVYALPNAIHKDRCEEVRNEVEVVLRDHYGVRVPLELIVDDGSTAISTSTASVSNPIENEEEIVDLTETILVDSEVATSPADRLLQAFPGAEELK